MNAPGAGPRLRSRPAAGTMPDEVPPLTINLLGRPHVVCDGQALPAPRGQKAWALLAYVLCAERPPGRDELVTELFGEAEDPLGALRWNLSALRRVLPGAELGGDPVRLELPAGSRIDSEVLTSGSWVEAVALPGLGRELLEGMAFATSPAFEIWLVAQRRHLGAAAEAALREGALARLGAGDAAAAVELATQLVRLNPLDEGFQELLVRSLAASGDGIGAARQVARCRELLRRELGVEPSAALLQAGTVSGPSASAPVGGRAAATAQLEAGEAAIAAGATDPGLHCLRRAVADARAAGADDLQARALVALGGALVHAARGRDEEAAAALHEALALAGRPGMDPYVAAAMRELGYVEFLRARYDRAEQWLAQASDLAGDDLAEQGHIGAVRGSALSDMAEYGQAIDVLGQAIEQSTAVGERKRASYSVSMLGRVHLLREELGLAAELLDRATAMARSEGWVAFTPWPEALRGEVELLEGDVDAAHARLERAFALGCQLGDPCWEGLAARGLGRVAALRDDVDEALRWLTDARQRSSRLPDGYVWVEAYTLDALCAVAVDHGLASASEWVEDLASLAARGGMRELAVRACLHRAALGDAAAATAARMFATGIDSPALHGRLAAAGAPG